MELNPILHKVQGILKNEEITVGSLSTIKKDNQTDIVRIISKLKQVVAGEEFNDRTKKIFYVLLFLNTDLDVCKILKKSRKYAHIVGFFPMLSRDLFMKVVVELKFYQNLYESVEHLPSVLSYQILEMTLKTLSWIDLFESVTLVENVLVCLFSKITVLTEEDTYNTPLKEMFQTLLLHYNAEKGGSIKRMGQWKSSKLKHYAGLVMASMLSLLEKCSKIYLKKENNANTDDFSLYHIHIEESNMKDDPTKLNKNKFITTQNCYEHVVAKCYENICSVTVDLWLSWVEIDLDDIPDTENTLQRLVGESAYTCREVLMEIQCLVGVSPKEVSDLIIKLQNMAIKPKSEEEVAETLDLVQILSNVKDPNKDSKKWLKFLVNNSALVVDPDSLEVLKSCVNTLPAQDFLALVNTLFEHIKSKGDNKVQKDFILEVTKSLDFDYQTQLSLSFINHFGLSNILKREDFQPVFVETFNKITNVEDKEKEIYSQFLCLALESAEEVVCKAVTEGITSEVRGHLMADILGRLQPFCDANPILKSDPLLVVALERLFLNLPNLPETHRSNYPLFVRELVMRKSLDGKKFIEVCLMSKMHIHLKSKNLILISACLETLSELNDIDCVHHIPTCLVMLIQVVQAFRWSPSNFSMANEQVCELGLEMVDKYITKLLESDIQEEQRRMLLALVKNCSSPLNHYHFSRLMTDEQMPTELVMQLIYRMHYGIGEWSIEQVTEKDRLKLIYELCYVLPVLTNKEWQELFCVVTPKCSEFICLFHIVTDALLLCLDSTKVNTDPTVLSCLTNTIMNVAEAIKFEVNRWNSNDNEYRISVLRKMCQLVSELPENQQETVGRTLVKVLQQLLPQGSRRQPLTEEEKTSTTASIVSIKAASVRQALTQEFLEMMYR